MASIKVCLSAWDKAGIDSGVMWRACRGDSIASILTWAALETDRLLMFIPCER
jgi:hypothetical protein